MKLDLWTVAEQELRENEANRKQSLEQMRDYISKNPDIKFCRDDDLFLLRFLRTKKFSVPAASAMLERFLTLRHIFPQWFQTLDPEEDEVADLLSAGYMFPLPCRDSLGRRVVFTITRNIDPSRVKSSTVIKVVSIVMEYMMSDEESQVRGVVQLHDVEGMSLAHLGQWQPSDIRNLFKFGQQSCPMRFKESHIVNVPPIGMKLFDLISSFLSEKLKSRNRYYRSIDEIPDTIPKSILPKEYGGEVPVKEIVAGFVKEARAMRQELLDLDNLVIEISKKNRSIWEEDIGSVAGSFKKLDID